jgi:hypothetical protein
LKVREPKYPLSTIAIALEGFTIAVNGQNTAEVEDGKKGKD